MLTCRAGACDMKQTNEYSGVDLVKWLMALCVIALHTEPLHAVCEGIGLSMYYSVVDCAVPYFFIASGFFLGLKLKRKPDSSLSAIKSMLIRMLGLYAVWSVVYLPLAIADYVAGGLTPVQAVINYVIWFFAVGEHYNSWMLWYLLATIYALVYVWLCTRWNIAVEKQVCLGAIVTLVVLILRLVTSAQDVLPVQSEQLLRLMELGGQNGRLVFGFFYIPLGMLLAKHPMQRQKSIVIMVTAFLLSCLCMKREIKAFLVIPCAMSLFSWSAQLHLPTRMLWYRLRKHSTVIYFIHMYVWTAYYMLVYRGKIFGPDSFVVTAVVSEIIACIWCLMVEKQNKQAI